MLIQAGRDATRRNPELLGFLSSLDVGPGRLAIPEGARRIMPQ